MIIIDLCFYFRIKVEYGEDGLLESRLYLSRAGRGDTGRYSCHMPGLQKVTPATINLYITQGEAVLRAAIEINELHED
jgi:hypothetical protein